MSVAGNKNVGRSVSGLATVNASITISYFIKLKHICKSVPVQRAGISS